MTTRSPGSPADPAMPDGPVVSVIMPFRDMERFIGEAMESVRAQTFADWELLLIDDGSTDDSRAMATQLAERDPRRVMVLEHEGGASLGASAARNLGLRHARGPFVALLDADDVWLPRKLEDQVAILQRHPDVDVVYGRTLWWYSWTGAPGGGQRDHLPHLGGVRPGRPVKGTDLLRKVMRNAAQMPTTCSLLARRSAVEEAGGFEDEFRTVYTDQVFFAKLCLVSTMLPVDHCWDWYRRRPDSSSALGTEELRQARLRYLTWLAGHLDRTAPGHADLAAAVQRELRWTARPAALQRARRLVHRLPGRFLRISDHLRGRRSGGDRGGSLPAGPR
jgi:glycosyltransferase involved in cell wall biosynthesis